MEDELDAFLAGNVEDTSHADTAAEDIQDDLPGADAAAADDQSEGGEQPRPKGKSAQDRIDELVRDKHAERRAREAAERRLAELEAQVRPQPKTDAPQADAEPDPSQYTYGETDPGFIRDLARFEAKQAFKAEAEQAQRRTQAQTIDQAWNERQQSFAKDTPDYFQVLDSDWVCTPVMADAIKTSDEGAAVAYHLAQHPDEARRIAGLPQLAQVRELGKLEAKLATPAAASTPQPKTVSDAPAPHPTARGAGGRFATPPDTDDLDAFEKQFFRNG